MTRRLLRSKLIAAIALVVSWFCVFAGNTAQHTSLLQSAINSCASCHTDAQSVTTLKINEEKNEIEPTPPPFWVQSIVPLNSLYSFVLIIFLGYLIQRHKIHLTTQMRF